MPDIENLFYDIDETVFGKKENGFEKDYAFQLELKRYREAVGAEAVAVSKEKLVVDLASFKDFISYVDSFTGMVPETFHKIFLFAQHLECFVGQKTLDQICGLEGEDLVTKQKPNEQIPTVSSGYQIFPEKRKSQGVEDLALLQPEDLLRSSIAQLIQLAESGELDVCDFVVQGPETKDKFATLPDNNDGHLLTTEQDLYILLDLSWSMNQDDRLLYAQTLILYYLNAKFVKQKKRPRIHLRAFAIDVGDLVQANDIDDLPEVINEILAADARQKGTDIDAAFNVAASDVNYHIPGHGPEMLLVTDGLSVIDPKAIRESFPKDTKIRVVKIGDDKLTPTDGQMKEMHIPFAESMSGEQKLGEATKIFNNGIDRQWQSLADTLIVLPDISRKEMAVSAKTIRDVGDFLEKEILNISFEEVGIALKRQGIFSHDFLRYILNNKEILLEEGVRAEIQSLETRLSSWLAKGMAVEVESRFAPKDSAKPVPQKLRLGKQKAAISLGRGGAGIMKVNILNLIGKLLIAVAKKIASFVRRK